MMNILSKSIPTLKRAGVTASSQPAQGQRSQSLQMSLSQDACSLRFSGTDSGSAPPAATAPADTAPATPAAAEAPQAPLPELSAKAQMVLGTTREVKQLGPDPKLFWPASLMKYLCMDASVEKYLEDQQLKASSVFLALETALPKKLADSGVKGKCDLTPGLVQQIVNESRSFTREQGNTLVTPVDLWRWLMLKDPNGQLELILKYSGFDDKMVGRLRKAPAVKKPFHMRKGRPTKDVILKLRSAAAEMAKKVLGQPKGLTRMVDNIKTAMLGYSTSSKPNKPASITIILGPSGVGKTLTADELARVLDCDKPIYEQMNQYKDSQNAAKLTGSAPGYIGYGDGNSFADKVIRANEATAERGTPPPIIVFDEIEKANAKVFDVLMQVFDRGELPNGTGQTATFGGTHIILTSNVGQERIRQALKAGASDEEINEIAREELMKAAPPDFEGFRPEFLGRINSVIVYESLTKEDCGLILDKELRELKAAILKDDNYNLEIAPEVREYILEKGYNEKTGARAVQNFVRDSLLTDLVKKREDLIVDDKLTDPPHPPATMKTSLIPDPNNEGFKKIIFDFIPAQEGAIQGTLAPAGAGDAQPVTSGS